LEYEWGQWLGLALLGLGVGAFGTLIGVGGGFILVPVLLVLYPEEPVHIITSISLAVAGITAASGSLAYARLGRIDYRAGLLFAATSAPGAVLGALATRHLPRGIFDTLFGIFLIAVALYLLLGPKNPRDTSLPATRNLRLGAILSFGVGFFSSLFGIGGGFIQVPMLVQVLGYPSHIATATSQFTLMFTAAAGTITHILLGEFERGVRRTIALGIGVIIGAQVGARLAQRVHGLWLMRLLAFSLLAVGARLTLGGLLPS
jgi:uncharacterized membrane protein YfcA